MEYDLNCVQWYAVGLFAGVLVLTAIFIKS
jgi:hypothetical protein